MPRLTPITNRDQVGEDGLAAFDAIIESRGAINAPQSMHMYVPEIARCSNDLSDSLRYRSHLSDHDTELAIITAAGEMDCDYVWSGHSQAALRAGVRQEAVDIVANLGSLDGLTDDEKVIVRFGREVGGDHKLSQEAFDAAVDKFGEANTIVLGALIGHYTMMSCTLIATDTQPAEGAPVLPKRP